MVTSTCDGEDDRARAQDCTVTFIHHSSLLTNSQSALHSRGVLALGRGRRTRLHLHNITETKRTSLSEILPSPQIAKIASLSHELPPKNMEIQPCSKASEVAHLTTPSSALRR